MEGQNGMFCATDIMTPDVITIRSAATVEEAINMMQSHGLHALIVNQRHGQDAFGIVTDHDILAKVIARGVDPKTIRVLEIMTKPCITINPDLGIDYVARLLVTHGIRQAPVIQKDLLGIISLTDILEHSHRFTSSEIQLNEAVDRAIAHARQTCESAGTTSRVCAESWKAVEELQAEVAYLRLERLERTAFEHYRDDLPDTIDAEEYDAWCSG